MNNPKLFIGPMSKNVVDCVLNFSQEFNNIGFIPSRRQIDYCGGYVNNWNTKSFSEYVKKHNSSVLICRDHGGENQGQDVDDGIKSFEVDCDYFDLIHVDTFKTSETIELAAKKTKNVIQKLWNINPSIFYEVGTEEAIFKYNPKQLKWFLDYLQKNLSQYQFNQIKYAVVQSGTGLDLPKRKNTGKFNKDLLLEFIDIVKQFGLYSKEHNGDYLSSSSGIKERFDLGLDAINIAPEFGQIETDFYLNECKDTKLFDVLYKICYNSGKWKKWIPEVSEASREQIIITCCHYVLSENKFTSSIKCHFPNSDNIIREKINSRLKNLNEQTKNYCL
jgi:hypothetical protein